ncbi:MAG TPA: RNA polymerase sigma factor SigM [Marmoricola sp.]|nr:RNA polymerase sigma factor SigM [Marmoricola sp.]
MTSGPGPLEERSDPDLLAAHVAGDPDAFGVLFRRHRDRLWAVALRTTGNREEAADALQEAMVAAFRRASSYRGDAAVTTWLHRVVVNACLDRLRRAKVRATQPLPDDLEQYAVRGAVVADPAAGTAADPEAHVLEGERRATLLGALRRLPEEQRAALVLVDMEGLPVDEVARVLDCAPGTVKSRCSRGRARLAVLLAEAGITGTGRRPAPSHPGGRPETPASQTDQTQTDQTQAPPTPEAEGGVVR